MEIINKTLDFKINTPSVITLGKFDGIHRGHELLMEELKNKSKVSYTNAFTVVINTINAEVVELLKKDTFKNV